MEPLQVGHRVAVSKWRPLAGGEQTMRMKMWRSRGVHELTVVYRGGGWHLPSVSAAEEFTVN